jgi:chemotaxis signal transduction protein
MNTSHSDDNPQAQPPTGEPLTLAQLLALAGARTGVVQHPESEQAAGGSPGATDPEGDPYLQFTCADITCAAPLTCFREVLPTLPTTIMMPFSPPWMLGLFALHTELIGLVDPAPILFDAPDLVGLSRSRAHNGQVIVPGSRKTISANWRLSTPDSGPTALILGAGEKMLALAVSGVGDLVYARPGEIHEGFADPSVHIPAARFRVGALTRQNNHHGQNDHNGQSVVHVVKMDVLFDDLLAALTSMEAAPHE